MMTSDCSVLRVLATVSLSPRSAEGSMCAQNGAEQVRTRQAISRRQTALLPETRESLSANVFNQISGVLMQYAGCSRSALRRNRRISRRFRIVILVAGIPSLQKRREDSKWLEIQCVKKDSRPR